VQLVPGTLNSNNQAAWVEEYYMPKLSARGLKWLKGFHLIAVSCWIGGGFALVLLYFLKNDVTDGGVLYGINQSTHHVDWVVVMIPGAFGCLVTGSIFSAFSNWGFFRHTWIVQMDRHYSGYPIRQLFSRRLGNSNGGDFREAWHRILEFPGIPVQ
jgi:hypothetical protein